MTAESNNEDLHTTRSLACEHCGTTRNVFMFDCKRCHKRLCVRCRVPELHNCISVVWVFAEKYTKHYLNDYQMPDVKKVHRKFK